MKILEITFDLSPGGAERFVVDLSNELSKTNEVTLMALKDDKVNPERRLFYQHELSNRVTYKNIGIADGFYFGLFLTVYNAIKSEHPDVVHIHGTKMPFYCLMAICLLRKHIRFYQTIHCDFNHSYNTWFYKILFVTIGYKHLIKFIALSETNYNDLMKMHPKLKATCILNGRAPVLPSVQYDKVKAEMSEYKHDESSIIFLHIARCSLQKDQMLLVNAFNQFLERGYNADLVVIGDGFESELGVKIKSNACSRIHFIGTRQIIGDYMLSADIFCLSSAYEGMPITILEACLAGVPVLSTPVCGAIDVITDGVNGIISKGHSISDYVEALECSYMNLTELKYNSMKMKNSSKYTIDCCAKKYFDYFIN